MYGPPLPALFNNWLWYSQTCNQRSLYGKRKSDHKRTCDALFKISRSRLSVKLSNGWLVGLGLLGLTPFSTIFQLYRVIFPCKNYSFWGLLFSIFWFVKRHSFKTARTSFSVELWMWRHFHRSSNLCIFCG
jgi:hypothetical protein